MGMKKSNLWMGVIDMFRNNGINQFKWQFYYALIRTNDKPYLDWLIAKLEETSYESLRHLVGGIIQKQGMHSIVLINLSYHEKYWNP